MFMFQISPLKRLADIHAFKANASSDMDFAVVVGAMFNLMMMIFVYLLALL